MPKWTVMRLASFSAALTLAGASANAQDAALQGRGEGILKTNCAYCHAIGRAGESPHRGAPPFRVLMQRYKPEALEEALGEGLVTGHPDMPEFVFAPPDIAAIVAYLNTLQRVR